MKGPKGGEHKQYKRMNSGLPLSGAWPGSYMSKVLASGTGKEKCRSEAEGRKPRVPPGLTTKDADRTDNISSVWKGVLTSSAML